MASDPPDSPVPVPDSAAPEQATDAPASPRPNPERLERRGAPAERRKAVLVALGGVAMVAGIALVIARPWARHACPAGMLPVVPPGEVWIGSPNLTGEEDERPRHPVTLEPYCMDKTEVTVADYAKCVAAGNTKCRPAGTGEYCNGDEPDRQNHPVNCVSWEDAKAYCEWRGSRLPSEEEWEFAARGPEERLYPWGNEVPTNQLCWYGEGNDLGKGEIGPTCPVGAYPRGASPFGLLDMAGNAWEWTASAYCEYPSNSCGDPRRVLRGGSRWNIMGSLFLRGAHRHGVEPIGSEAVGFRCAKTM